MSRELYKIGATIKTDLIIVHNGECKFLIEVKVPLKISDPKTTVLTCADIKHAREKFNLHYKSVVRVITSDKDWAQELRSKYPRLKVTFFKGLDVSALMGELSSLPPRAG